LPHPSNAMSTHDPASRYLKMTTAIILAGGFGTRLQSLVSDLPKPMAPVNGKPFLEYQLRYLKHFGLSKVIISTGHLAERIRSHFGSGFNGLEIKYSHETQPLGTGGGIRLAMSATHEKELLVLNGDSFFDLDLSSFYKQHCSSGSECSLALRKVENASRYGTIRLKTDNQIGSFLEKTGTAGPGTINAGAYLIDRETFLSNTPPHSAFSIEKDFFETKLSTLKIFGFVHEGYFIDIGIPEDYRKAQHDFKGFKY
jgi:D-glycero-alpha-D-manno-heptose 1-phosphate guanylyltransferase